jgi:hypothetical protein
MVAKVQSYKLGEKTSAVLVTLTNGFEICATSACVRAEDFNEEIGFNIAMSKAMDKIWELEGYRVQIELAYNNKIEMENVELIS